MVKKKPRDFNFLLPPVRLRHQFKANKWTKSTAVTFLSQRFTRKYLLFGKKPNKLEQVSFSEIQTRKHKHYAKSCSLIHKSSEVNGVSMALPGWTEPKSRGRAQSSRDGRKASRCESPGSPAATLTGSTGNCIQPLLAGRMVSEAQRWEQWRAHACLAWAVIKGENGRNPVGWKQASTLASLLPSHGTGPESYITYSSNFKWS